MDGTETSPTAPAVERVRAALEARGYANPPVREFEERTATAVDAANALGTSVGHIVKSLVFMAGDTPLLVLTSGPNRVDVTELARLQGASIRRANADEVRSATGFSIGGVPPLGHTQTLTTYVDRDLLQYDTVWASAGTNNTVFSIDPHVLARITNAQVADLKQIE
jgi:prolyl-tRNA editing enzyme YbaK/EbsC (Cys-tRNA(Pro) deacylase)